MLQVYSGEHSTDMVRKQKLKPTNLIDLGVPRHDLEDASANNLRLVDVTAAAACSRISEEMEGTETHTVSAGR